MNDLVRALQETPLPTILVIAGIFFLFLSIAGGLAGKINIPPNRQKISSIFGILLLVVGLAIHLIPAQNRQTSTSPPDESIARAKTAVPREKLPETNFKNWPVVGEDAFIAPNDDWWTGEFDDEGSKGSARIVSGKYRWEANFKKSWEQRQLSSYDPASNFYVATDISLKPQPSNFRISGGLIFRNTYNKGYSLYLLSNSYIQLVFRDNDKFKILLDWTYIPKINTDGTNRLAVLADGPSMKIYINEKLYASVKDSSQLNGGVGLIFAGQEEKGVSGVVDFDNFIFRKKP